MLPCPELFDSHCHFDFDLFNGRREAIWQACHSAGVTRMVVPGITPSQWPKLMVLSDSLPGIDFAIGIHPWWVDDVCLDKKPDARVLQQLEQAITQAASHKRCVAIGECGLDKIRNTRFEFQLRLLRLHLELAQTLRKPIILHCVKAHNELIQLLNEFPNLSGVVHGFSGSLQIAQAYWQRGFYLGVGGTITYERAAKTREAIKNMPLEALLLETDAPDMPLSGKQGEPNSPLHLVDIAESVAKLKNASVATIASATTANALTLFSGILSKRFL